MSCSSGRLCIAERCSSAMLWLCCSSRICAAMNSVFRRSSSFSAFNRFTSSRISPSVLTLGAARFRFWPISVLSSSSVISISGCATLSVWTLRRCSFRFSCREKPLPLWRLQLTCGQFSCRLGPPCFPWTSLS